MTERGAASPAERIAKRLELSVVMPVYNALPYLDEAVQSILGQTYSSFEFVVSDLAGAHVLALERLIAQPRENLTLNCGYGRGLSVLEVLDSVGRVSGAPLRREMKPRRAGDTPELISSNRRLMETLAWTPRFADIDTIVTHALEWERKLEQMALA